MNQVFVEIIRFLNELKLWHRVSQEILKVHLTFACFPSSHRYWDVVHVQTLKAWRRYIGFTADWLPPCHFLPSFQSFVFTDRSGLPAFPLSDIGKGTKATDWSHFWLPRPLGGISDMLDNTHVLTLDRFLRIKNREFQISCDSIFSGLR